MGKKSSPPPPPDYAALAQQQGQINKEVAAEQTLANRPDQYTPWGSSTWDKNTDGTWTQRVNLSPEEQAALDRERQFNAQRQGMAGDLLDKAGDSLSTPLDLTNLPQLRGYQMDGLPELQGLDLSSLGGNEALPELQGMELSEWNNLDSGFGAVESVRDAMMGRLGQSRQQARESEINRLKSQGLPEDSVAFQKAMERIDQGDTDAEQQALLGAMGAYNDIFNRGLAENSQLLSREQSKTGLNLAQRGQLFGENQATRQRGLTETLASRDAASKNRAQLFGEQGAAAQLAGLLRQQSLAEQEKMRQSPLDDFLKLTAGISPGQPQMPSFMGGTGYQGPDMYGAAKDSYSAAMDRYNADQASGAGLTSGLFGLAGSAIGGPFGGQLGKWMFGG